MTERLVNASVSCPKEMITRAMRISMRVNPLADRGISWSLPSISGSLGNTLESDIPCGVDEGIVLTVL